MASKNTDSNRRPSTSMEGWNTTWERKKQKEIITLKVMKIGS
jgi:hypothetical protein